LPLSFSTLRGMGAASQFMTSSPVCPTQLSLEYVSRHDQIRHRPRAPKDLMDGGSADARKVVRFFEHTRKIRASELRTAGRKLISSAVRPLVTFRGTLSLSLEQEDYMAN
jgi:hypothetical protein